MTLIVLSTVIALAFLALGVSRVLLIPMSQSTTARIGLVDQQLRVIGVLEVIFAVLTFLGIWIGWMGWIGSLMLTVIAAGAILAHSRVADAPVTYIAPSVLGILSFILFLMHIY